MSLRERHRQLINQSTLNNDIDVHSVENNDTGPLPSVHAESTSRSTDTAPSPSPISIPSIGLSMPKTTHIIQPTEADLKRKAYLAAAKERNEKTKQQFEDRVKGYFEKGLAMEQQKMMSGVKIKKSNKEANAEAVENGLFLQQLKQIGIDVGKCVRIALF
jgi:hypothetical protein